MAVTSAQFRLDFPEFADTDVFPDTMVNFWLAFALGMLNQERWGSMLYMGLELMTAHQLVLADRNGYKPGVITAPQGSKAVDKVNVSYDTSAVTLENGGHWNGTSYGIQFLQLARMMGSGGMQL